MFSCKKQIGFTLIELIVTVALFAVLASFAIPSYQNMVQNTQIRTATDSVLAGMQLARAEAVKRNTNVQFALVGGDSGWTVCVSPAGAGACPGGASTIQSRSGSSPTVTAGPNNGPYVFNSFGLLTSPAGGAAITIDNTALSAAESRELDVRVAAGGSVRSCDPYTGLTATDPRKCP